MFTRHHLSLLMLTLLLAPVDAGHGSGSHTTRDNVPQLGGGGDDTEDLSRMFNLIFGDTHATPRKIVAATIAKLDSAPSGIAYRGHLMELAFERARVATFVPDQLTVLAMRAFADALQGALTDAGEWSDDYTTPDAPGDIADVGDTAEGDARALRA